MPTVSFTSSLKRFFPSLEGYHTSANTLLDVMDELTERFPGLIDYLLDENRAIREHVNIFVGGKIVKSLVMDLDASDEVYIMQAMSGG